MAIPDAIPGKVLAGERLVPRVDLKAECKAGRLGIVSAH